MEDELSQHEGLQQGKQSGAEEFVPRGAIAFMVVLILVYAAVWFYFYAMMTSRP
jgi:hypothetical protein